MEATISSVSGTYVLLAFVAFGNGTELYALGSDSQITSTKSSDVDENTHDVEGRSDVGPSKNCDVDIHSLYKKEYLNPRPLREWKGHRGDVLSLDWSKVGKTITL